MALLTAPFLPVSTSLCHCFPNPKANKEVNCIFGWPSGCDSGMETQMFMRTRQGRFPGGEKGKRKHSREQLNCLTRATHSLANTQANVAQSPKESGNLDLKNKNPDY